MTEIEQKRLEILLRHVHNVQQQCEYLGNKLIEAGEDDIGRKLIANGLIHDNSKFYGIEWDYLHDDVKSSHPDLFKAAANQHIHTNLHHPEAHTGGVNTMSPELIAEMVCDWRSRSIEFGNDIREWVKNEAKKRFKISTKTMSQINKYLNLLLDKPFK